MGITNWDRIEIDGVCLSWDRSWSSPKLGAWDEIHSCFSRMLKSTDVEIKDAGVKDISARMAGVGAVLIRRNPDGTVDVMNNPVGFIKLRGEA